MGEKMGRSEFLLEEGPWGHSGAGRQKLGVWLDDVTLMARTLKACLDILMSP